MIACEIDRLIGWTTKKLRSKEVHRWKKTAGGLESGRLKNADKRWRSEFRSVGGQLKIMMRSVWGRVKSHLEINR